MSSYTVRLEIDLDADSAADLGSQLARIVAEVSDQLRLDVRAGAITDETGEVVA